MAIEIFEQCRADIAEVERFASVFSLSMGKKPSDGGWTASQCLAHLADAEISLALRLFGNILAGFILVEVFLQLAPPVVPSVLLFFELFVGLIQALIFSVLTLAFLSMATEHGGGHEEHEADEHEAAHH